MAPQRDTFQRSEVTLMNVADGALERDFQEALREMEDVIACSDEFRHDATGRLKMRIEGALDVEVKDGVVTVIGGMALKRPKRKTTASALYRGKGGKGWRVDDNFEGLELFGQRKDQDEKEPTR